MALKSKKAMKKLWRDKFKEVNGEYPEPRFMSNNGVGKMQKFSLKKNVYKISNQKGAFGDRTRDNDGMVYQTFSETNHERHLKRRKRREESKIVPQSVVEGAKGLLARTLGA